MNRVAAEGYRFDRIYSASNFTLASLTAILTARFGSTTGVLGWDKGLQADEVPTLPEVLGYYGYKTGAFTIDAASGFRPDYGLHRGFQHMEIIPPPVDTPDGRRRRIDGAPPVGGGGDSAAPAVAWLEAQGGDDPVFVMFHTRTAHFPFVISDAGVDSDATGVTRELWDAGEAQSQRFGEDVALPGMAGGTSQKGVRDGGPDPVQQTVLAAGDEGLTIFRDHYADAVAWTDRDIQVIYDALEASGRLERTVLAVVADHGESLGDHGELLHGDAYFDNVVRVPFLLRIPGQPGGVIDALVSQVDIGPTLLEIVGAVPPGDADGRSAVGLITGRADAIRASALVEGGVALAKNDIPRGAVVTRPWTLLRQDMGCGPDAGRTPHRRPGHPASCLFDVDVDPGQTKNLAVEEADRVAALLDGWDAFRADRAGEATQLALDAAFVEALHKSGYDFEPVAP